MNNSVVASSERTGQGNLPTSVLLYYWTFNVKRNIIWTRIPLYNKSHPFIQDN